MYDFNHLYEPASVNEAIEMMHLYPEAKIIAGGSDLLVQLRDGVHAGCDLISIYMLDELRGITINGQGDIRIGALTSFSKITKNPLIQKYISVLGDAADTVGGPQIRNIGTIGGNICNGHTGADTASTLFALDALIEVTDKNGVHIMPVSEFYKTNGGVHLNGAQLLTAVIIPKESYDGYTGAYYKYAARNAMDVDIVGCSVNIKLSENRKMLEDVRMAFGVVGPHPVRVFNAENIVKGCLIGAESSDVELANILADESLKEIYPRTDFRASKEFRIHIAHEIAKRTFLESLHKAGLESLHKTGGDIECRGN